MSRQGLTIGAAMAGLALAGCEERARVPAHLQVPGGDPEIGRAIMADAGYGCGGCHVIPGVRGALGTAGPPLTAYALRGYVAGQVPNRPGALVAWLVDPPAIAPGTAMPATGLDEAGARHVAAYLYTLGDDRGWPW